ncbi:MAG: DUF3189 family protein [Bacillota bacterium]|nr:DUF3189 family protein [Bacillota bacterium]
MKVVFHCYGGTHASPVTAALYLRQLDGRRRPAVCDLLRLTLFDQVEPRDFGRLIPVGDDEAGNQVYVLGCGRHPQIVLRALAGFLRLLGGNPEELLLVDVSPHINIVMRVGGFTSRVLRLVSVGRPLVGFGTVLAFPRLARLAEETRRRVEERRRGAALR